MMKYVMRLKTADMKKCLVSEYQIKELALVLFLDEDVSLRGYKKASPRHLHYSEMTACVLYDLVSNPLHFFCMYSQFWSGGYSTF